MMITDTAKKAYLAVDTSYDQGALVLLASGSIIFRQMLEEKLSHGKSLCEALKHAELTAKKFGYDVDGILCGLGPGSFVGIRIALATMLGFSFARSLPLMGFCSHLALAYSLKCRRENFYIYMKASGSLGYLTRFFIGNDQIEKDLTTVVSLHDLPVVVKNNTAVFSNLAQELEKVLLGDVDITPIVGPTPLGIARASLHRLRLVGAFVDESHFIKPNYVKPPNVSSLSISLSSSSAPLPPHRLPRA